MNSITDQYPEHIRLKAVSEKSQAIGEFLAYAAGRGSRGRKAGFIRRFGSWRWMNTTQILAEYFKIDLEKIEDEKRAMLESLRISPPIKVVKYDKAPDRGGRPV